MNECLGVLVGNTPSFIDHLVPLCSVLNCPLLCTDEEIFLQILYYYPFDQVELVSPEHLEERVQEAKALITVDHYKMPLGGFQFPDLTIRSSAKSICALHGNSDKKRNAFWIERFCDEDVVLLYGDFMVDFLNEKRALERCQNWICTGNVRLHYYLKHQAFFDQKVAPRSSKKRIFYAPTWTSSAQKSEWKEDFSPFFSVSEALFKNVPTDVEFFVKLHPYMMQLDPEKIAQLVDEYPEVKWVTSPVIYPLLSQMDCYVGDYSSIGYDFLYFNKPLYFLSGKKETDPLFACGTVIEDPAYLFHTILQEKDVHAERRRETYSYVFGDSMGENQLKQTIIEALCG